MPAMKTLIANLKAEITRLARKEVAAETGALKKALSAVRTSNAELKREVVQLKRDVTQLRKSNASTRSAAVVSLEVPDGFRFSGKWLAAQRRRLGLSGVDMGLLLQASNQSVGKWETKGVRPHKEFLPRIAALATLSKADAQSRIERIVSKSAA